MKTLDWSVETLGPEYNSSAWALYSFIETDYLYFYYFLMQVNKLIEENKKELDYLLNEMNLSEYRGQLEKWSAEITACGKRMYTYFPIRTHGIPREAVSSASFSRVRQASGLINVKHLLSIFPSTKSFMPNNMNIQSNVSLYFVQSNLLLRY